MTEVEIHTERRNRPGTKASVITWLQDHIFSPFVTLPALKEYYRWPEESFEEMDSTLAVQQYIQQLIRKDFTAIDDILRAPDSQDEGVWKYEHLR
jgi:hypothetical protein